MFTFKCIERPVILSYANKKCVQWKGTKKHTTFPKYSFTIFHVLASPVYLFACKYTLSYQLLYIRTYVASHEMSIHTCIYVYIMYRQYLHVSYIRMYRCTYMYVCMYIIYVLEKITWRFFERTGYNYISLPMQ